MAEDKSKWPRFKVHFQDEAPRIGSGVRRVVAKVGWKWVRIHVPHAGRTAKIRRRVWDKLNAEPLD